MTQYSQKIIQNLKPNWYMALSTKEKLKEQSDLKEGHKEALLNKPKSLMSGTKIIAKESTSLSLTKGKKYVVKNHFCSLVSTIYDSNWNQFVTLKNDSGYIVKMNLRNFELTDKECSYEK